MSSNSEYDFRRDWPDDERHRWTGVTGRIWHNPSTGVIRLTFSGEWPEQSIITADTTVVERTTADGRIMQVDVHGLRWE